MSERVQTTEFENEGIFPAQALRHAVTTGAIRATRTIEDSQFQPASLDLRLGRSAWRVSSSFLPGPERTVKQKAGSLKMHSIDLTKGAVLERGCVYIVRLLERLALPAGVMAYANPKSSAGRLDVFVRIVRDRGDRFDHIPKGYKGPLFAEVSPRTFSIKVREGSRLAQLRLQRGDISVSSDEIRTLIQHHKYSLFEHVSRFDERELEGRGEFSLAIDLVGQDREKTIGWRARRHAGVIDIDHRHYKVSDFWERITASQGRLFLDPDDFYILSTKESVVVPPEFAAEMLSFDPMVGEFRTHYAGFFDPGFGYSPKGDSHGSKAVLEIRSRDVPFLLEHGQMIGRLRYERLASKPDIVYGPSIGSHYQGQKLKLAKQFG